MKVILPRDVLINFGLDLMRHDNKIDLNVFNGNYVLIVLRMAEELPITRGSSWLK